MSTGSFQGAARSYLLGLLLVVTLLCLTRVAPALAVEAEAPVPFAPTAEEVREAEANAKEWTHPQAAEELSRDDLGREEAAELMEAVFGPLLDSPAGVFDDLQVERFLSNHAAVISAGSVPRLLDEPEAGQATPDSMLLESTVPLRTVGPDGSLEAVDLDLERSDGELEPANPLIDATIPGELGEGVKLPGANVEIRLAGAPADRGASFLGDSVAFYPNVATDTDLAIAPSARGVETLTQIRTREAPLTQVFDLVLPNRSELTANRLGGAEATLDGRPLIVVSPPTAVDAKGRSVPVTMAVRGSSLVVTVTPDDSTAYPVAVDPTIQDAYNWYYDGHPGWTSYRTPSSLYGNFFKEPDSGCSTYCFLRVAAAPGGYAQNSQAYWQYAVPRFYTDYETYAERPRSWVQAYSLGYITFTGGGEYQANPGALFAVSDQAGSWRSASIYPPNISGSYAVNLNTDHTGKLASFGLFTAAPQGIYTERYLLTGEAQVVLGDETSPVFGTVSSPAGWVNNQAKPFNMSVSDTGLGVRKLVVKNPAGESIGTTLISNSCTGTVRSTCPRSWKGAQEGNQVNYNPTSLPAGTNNLQIEAVDPVGNAQTSTLQLKVDHAAPELALSGTIMQQSTLGKTLPQYTVVADAKDGTLASPQSGVAKAEIKVDGVKVKESAPGCATQNCSLWTEWTLTSSSYGTGPHVLEVIATDGAGIKTSKVSLFEIQRDTVAPTLTATAFFYTAPDGWLEQQSYSNDAAAQDANGYGVTSLTLKLDGQVVKSVTGSCAAGRCGKAFVNSTIGMTAYQGGAHQAELIAVDGAGNTAKKAWTVNVNPSGAVMGQEAASTLEAADATSESAVVSPNSEVIPQAEREEGNDPKLVQEGSTLKSVGAPTSVEYGSTLSGGVVLDGAEGSVTVTPASASGSQSSTTLVEESASVTSNVASQADTVIRPIYDGVMAFQSIRGATAPETYSWAIEMGTGQYLEQVTEHTVELFYADGTPAMAITAEPAHDAVGASVPTTIAKTAADQVTLTVKHRNAGAVYPVVAGPGFEIAYAATVVTEPQAEQPPSTEEGADAVAGTATIGAPFPGEADPEGGEASASRPSFARNANYALCSAVGCGFWNRHMKLHFHYNNNYAWWKNSQVHPNCTEAYSATQISQDLEYCDWIGPNHQTYGNGYHISAQLALAVTVTIPVTGITHQSHNVGTAYLYGDGYVSERLHLTGNICNPLSTC